ncbi:hypothetical protein FQN57_004899 [Myotisia sp. PD_48]|nr:hypothetical protein FQN57_004899 [Myotisia sp. PD_48]
MSVVIAPDANQTNLEDELMALALQVQELRVYDARKKGKYPAGKPPDTEVAFSTFEAEIQSHTAILRDLKLAHSIARAVEADGQAITDITESETQDEEGRRLALQIHGNGSQVAVQPTDIQKVSAKYPHRLAELPFEDDDEECSAGPSMSYAERQLRAIERFSQKGTQCCACLDYYQLYEIVRLECKDRYCIECFKNVILRATKDETYFPPRCCRQDVPEDLIANILSPDEMDSFDKAKIEFSTPDRTYCSGPYCGRFILPSQITGDKAECDSCSAATCTMCKNPFHTDDCPADPSLQATLKLGADEGWQRCYKCKTLIELDTGYASAKANFATCVGWNGKPVHVCTGMSDVYLQERGNSSIERQSVLFLSKKELAVSNKCETRFSKPMSASIQVVSNESVVHNNSGVNCVMMSIGNSFLNAVVAIYEFVWTVAGRGSNNDWGVGLKMYVRSVS